MKKTKKEAVVEAIIEKYDKVKDDVKIQTHIIPGYEGTGKIKLKGDNSRGYIPDVVVQRKDAIEFFEVELDDQYKLEKWSLLSLYSNKQKGSLNIVIPEEHLSQLRAFLENNNIKAKVFYFT